MDNKYIITKTILKIFKQHNLTITCKPNDCLTFLDEIALEHHLNIDDNFIKLITAGSKPIIDLAQQTVNKLLSKNNKNNKNTMSIIKKSIVQFNNIINNAVKNNSKLLTKHKSQSGGDEDEDEDEDEEDVGVAEAKEDEEEDEDEELNRRIQRMSHEIIEWVQTTVRDVLLLTWFVTYILAIWIFIANAMPEINLATGEIGNSLWHEALSDCGGFPPHMHTDNYRTIQSRPGGFSSCTTPEETTIMGATYCMIFILANLLFPFGWVVRHINMGIRTIDLRNANENMIQNRETYEQLSNEIYNNNEVIDLTSDTSEEEQRQQITPDSISSI